MQAILRQVDYGDQRIVSVCMNCLPGEKLFELFPWLRDNVEISHGICLEHKAQFLADMAKTRMEAA
jgi:hypothetical protein